MKDRNLAIVLTHLLLNRHRLEARAWLRGDSLPEGILDRLGVVTSDPDQLDKVSALKDDGKALASVLSETVSRQLLFILITVDDELNAYTVFETLNARGLELTTTDLLKNYLFSRVKVSFDLDPLQRR